ncbi:L,D-transpeptidase catalytic domain protein [Lysobacter antibioticus]|uniref:L,D-transpeptidase catalytic domain protein n=1 Tax=Lysobacter antibioticus TaxID=84531 RepID=A0A0S2FBW3_LYSAN|nr:L,D-transpeptidase catalytic domain protein [Lysobacter antibioticus]
MALLAVAPVAAACQESTVRAPSALPERGYVWTPQLSPRGPVTILVSLRDQRAYVYRNGARIGISKVSTGKTGHETPTGVFTILDKRREHFSNLYDNAPMPFMQRLTWGGVALHAGSVPEYPASHGCVRLPYAFAEKLFDITARGMTVVVSDAIPAPAVVYPGLFAATAPVTTIPTAPFVWAPERSLHGPITLVLSVRDREIVALRNAIEIGRAPVAISDQALLGTRVYLLLQGTGPGTSAVVPGRPALRWLTVSFDGPATPAQPDLRELVAAGRLRIDAEFAAQVYETLAPGATLVVTDEPLRQDGPDNGTILEAEQPESEARPAHPS